MVTGIENVVVGVSLGTEDPWIPERLGGDTGRRVVLKPMGKWSFSLS